MTKKDAIKLLELPDAEMYSVVEIRKAYRKAMQKNHPDHGGSTEMAQNINEAREYLVKYYATYADTYKEPILTKEQQIERIKFNIQLVFQMFIVQRIFFTKSEELYNQLSLLMNDEEIIKEVSHVNNPSTNYIFSILKTKAQKIITTYAENYCVQRGIKTSDLNSFNVNNIEFPFDIDNYVSKLQESYISYAKQFMENYAKELENYEENKDYINKIIKNLPYDECKPISDLTSVFVKKYYDIYKMKTDYNYLQMKYKGNLTSINEQFVNVLKTMSKNVDLYWNAMYLKKEINELKSSADILGNYLNLTEEDIVRSELIKQRVSAILGKCYMYYKPDLNMEKIKSYLHINIFEIKFPFIVDYFIRIINQIDGKTIEDLQKFKYEPIDRTKLNLSSPLDFNKIDIQLAVSYKKYVINYIRTLLNNKIMKLSEENKHAIVEEIFSNLYIYSKEDINDIISRYVIRTYNSGKHL